MTTGIPRLITKPLRPFVFILLALAIGLTVLAAFAFRDGGGGGDNGPFDGCKKIMNTKMQISHRVHRGTQRKTVTLKSSVTNGTNLSNCRSCRMGRACEHQHQMITNTAHREDEEKTARVHFPGAQCIA